MTTATLFAPKVRYASTFDSQFDAMTTWRAEIEMAYLSEEDTPDVLAGSVEFLIIRVGEHPIGDLLDSLSQDAEHFEVLFDGDDVAAGVQDQFDDAPFNRILIITEVTVAAPLRGHHLGAWLVSDVIDRMASPTDSLVLLYPHPLGADTDPATTAAAVKSLSTYWQRVGLVPIEDAPEFLGQATAYSHLPRARAALRAVADVEITVPASQIYEEKPDALRHAVVDEAESDPQRLRIVRD